MKKIIFLMLLLVLSACEQSQNTTIINKKEVNEFEAQGEFVSYFGKSRIEFLLEEQKKMYLFDSKLEKNLENLETGDLFSFNYVRNEEGRFVITNIKEIVKKNNIFEGNVISEEFTEEDGTLKELTILEKEKEIKQKSLKFEASQGYNIYLLPGFEINREEHIVLKGNQEFSLIVANLDNELQIKPLRWNASEELNKLGKLKELKNEEIYHPSFKDSEFVFYSTNEEKSKIIVVKRFENDLFRFTLTFPTKEKNNEIQSRLWAMMESLEIR